MAKATGEIVWWSLFAVGGVIAALFIPALIFVTGIAIPFVSIGAIEWAKFNGYPIVIQLVTSVIGRLVLFLATSLPLFHCAHRFVHTSKDLGLRAAHGLIAVICYGGAIAGTIFAFYVIWF
jgi:succinate dehydrogenase subunit D